LKKTEIIVRNFIITARIGIYPEEHKKPQKVCINITMKLADNLSFQHDNINETVSYEGIIKEIRAQSEVHHNLVENLAECLSNFCLNDIRVKSVSVQIEKIEIYPEGYVGCIITKSEI